MSSNYVNRKHILELPQEIIVKIINELPWDEIDNARRTCSAFNEAGKYVKSMALHKLCNKANSALKKCQQKLLNIHEDRLPRALRGEASLRFIVGIFQVLDAATLPLILNNSLPPISYSWLAELDNTSRLAQKRCFLGRDRLKSTFTKLSKYLISTLGGINSTNVDSMFRCVSRLLTTLPHVLCSIVPTSYGVLCVADFDHLTAKFNVMETRCIETYRPEALIVMTLAKLNLQCRLREYISQDSMFTVREDKWNYSISLSQIELKIQCADGADVTSLRQICLLEPTDFQLVMHGTDAAGLENSSTSKLNIDIEKPSFTYSFTASLNCVQEKSMEEGSSSVV